MPPLGFFLFKKKFFKFCNISFLYSYNLKKDNMRKIRLMTMTLMMFFLTMISFGQTQNSDNIKYMSVGDELIKFEKQYSTGVGLSVLGLGVVFAGSQHKDKTVMAIGGILGCLGSAMSIISHSHIKKAGLLLNEYGIGVKVKL